MGLKIRDLFISIGVEADEATLGRIDKGINQIKSSGNLAAFAIKGLTIAIGGMAVASALFLKQAGDFEQATVAFETMIGSAERAKKLLGDIQQFAAKTPFQFVELVTLSKRLLAFQFQAEEIIPVLNDLGNIAAGVGKEKLPQLIKALGDVRAAGHLRGLEVRQFIDTGVGIEKAVATLTGKTIKEVGEMISKRQVSFEMTRKAVELLSRTKFSNLMIKQSKTLLGALSNTIDILQILAVEIGGEMLPIAKELLIEFLKFVEINRKMIKSKTVAFFKAFGKAMLLAFRVTKAFTLGIIDLGKVFGGLENVVIAVAVALAFLTGGLLLSAIGNLTLGVYGFVKALKATRLAVLAVNAAVAVWPILVGIAVLAVITLIEDLVSFFQGKDSFTGLIVDKFADEWGKLLDKVKTILSGIKEAIITAGREIVNLPFFTVLASIKKAASEGISGIMSIPFSEIYSKVKGGLGGVLGSEPSISPASSPVSNTTGGIQINAPIEVNVPEGTPSGLIGPAITQGMNDALSGVLRKTLLDVEPITEF